jgi:glycosyltransferase involved in cell wall biosynthesis
VVNDVTVAAAEAPLVSVLVPAFNAAATLRETLDSVANQTFSNFQVIVVDDGSTDTTAAIAHEFAAADPRFQVFMQSNSGVAMARNRALAAATGSWIAPLDADDVWHPEKLERQLARSRGVTADTVLIYSWSVDIDETSHVIQRRLDLDLFEGDIYGALVLSNFIGNASVPLIRRQAALAVGGWDASLRAQNAQGCEDWALYLRLAELGPCALAPGFLVGYRQSGNSMSRRVAEMTRSYELVLSAARERHPELPAALFRWSRAQFDFYRFEMLLDAGAAAGSITALVFGLLRDPAWLARASVRRRVKRELRGLLSAGGLSDARALQKPTREPFAMANLDAPYRMSEGRWFDERRRYVSALRLRSVG